MTEWDIPNWTSLIVEICVAVFAICISIFFYRREKKGHKESQVMISAQHEKIKEMENIINEQKNMIKKMEPILEKQAEFLRQISRTTDFSEIIKEIGDEKMRQYRRRVRNDPKLTKLKNKKIEDIKISELPTEDEVPYHEANWVAVTYDRASLILRKNPTLLKEVLDFQGDVIEDMWLRLRPLIIKKWRKEEGMSKCVSYFEQLGKEAVEFMKSNNTQ